MANPNLQFIKSSGSPAVVNGAVWFNPTTGIIAVGENGIWKNVSGIQDATFDANKKLTIVKHDGSKVELDFSDVASAQVLGTLRTDLNNLTTKVGTAEGKITTIEGEIDALQAAVGTGADGLATKVADLETAVGKINDETLPALENELRGGYESSMKDLNDAIIAVGSKVDNNATEITGIKNAATTLTERVATAESEIDILQAHDTDYGTRIAAIETEIGGTNMTGTRIDVLEEDVNVLKGDGEGSVNKALADAKAYADDVKKAILTGDEGGEIAAAYDTIKEIAEWIAQDETDSANLAAQVATNTADVATLKTDVVTAKNAADAAQATADVKVASVTAGDATIVIGGTATNPTVKVAAETFDAYGAAEDAKTAVLGEENYGQTVKSAYELANTANGAAATAQATAEARVEKTAFETFKTENTAAISTAANTAETNAKAYADSLAGNYDAAGAAEAVRTELAEDIAANEARLDAVEAALLWATWE